MSHVSLFPSWNSCSEFPPVLWDEREKGKSNRFQSVQILAPITPMGFSRYLAQSEKTEIQLIWNNSMIKQNNKQLCE